MKKPISLLLATVMLISLLPSVQARATGTDPAKTAMETTVSTQPEETEPVENTVETREPEPAPVNPEEEEIEDEPVPMAYSGQCGINATYYVNNGAMSISGTGMLWGYSDEYGSNPPPWRDRFSINTAVISEGITSIGSYFFYCSGLQEVTLPESMTILNKYCFASTALYKILIPNNVTEIRDDAFRASSIKKVTMSTSLKTLGARCFQSCKKLETLDLPDSLESIGTKCFYDCTSLTNITIPEKITRIEAGTFHNCKSLKTIYFEGDAPYISSDAFFAVSVTAYYPRNNDTWTEEIFEEYQDTLSWAKITWIPYGEGAEETKCGDNLTWDLDTSGKLTISGTGDMWDFTDTPAPWRGDVVENTSVKSVVVESGVTSLGNNCFNSCTKLASISLPSTLKRIGDSAFSSCYALTSISIPYGVTDLGNACFNWCSGLKSITIPNSVKTIGWMCFYNCDSLASVRFPDSVTSIGDWCFYSCDALTEVILPNGLTVLDESFFDSCSKLTNITIPASVTELRAWCFSGCSSLESITFEGNAPKFRSSPFHGVTATAYYPKGNSTWTSSVMQNYGGTITWTPIGNSEDPTPTDATPVYRMYNPYTLENLFVNEDERAGLTAVGWIDRGIAWHAAVSGPQVYRMYNPYADFHIYTMSVTEIATMVSNGWKLDGVASCSAGDDGVPIWRLFNPAVKPEDNTCYHYYTIKQTEINEKLRQGWIKEGVAWYAAK